jgi:hypothetical protein
MTHEGTSVAFSNRRRCRSTLRRWRPAPPTRHSGARSGPGKRVGSVRVAGSLYGPAGQAVSTPASPRRDGPGWSRSPGFVGLPIRADEPALGIPSLPPLLLGKPGALQVLTGPECSAAAADDTDPPLPDPSLHPGQPSGEHLSAPLLLPVLYHDPNRPHEVGAGVVEVAPAPLPLVVRGSRQRARPPRRGYGGQSLLSVGALISATTQSATCGKIGSGQPAKMPTDRPQHPFVGHSHA